MYSIVGHNMGTIKDQQYYANWIIIYNNINYLTSNADQLVSTHYIVHQSNNRREEVMEIII